MNSTIRGCLYFLCTMDPAGITPIQEEKWPTHITRTRLKHVLNINWNCCIHVFVLRFFFYNGWLFGAHLWLMSFLLGHHLNTTVATWPSRTTLSRAVHHIVLFPMQPKASLHVQCSAIPSNKSLPDFLLQQCPRHPTGMPSSATPNMKTCTHPLQLLSIAWEQSCCTRALWLPSYVWHFMNVAIKKYTLKLNWNLHDSPLG